MLEWLFPWRRRRRALDSAGEFRNIVGPGATISGSISSAENCIVHGIVEGEGAFEGSLVLARGANWKGRITAAHIFVEGRVDGDVVAREKLELASSAHVTGSLTSHRIAIADGAVCEGMIHAPKDDATMHFRERRAASSR